MVRLLPEKRITRDFHFRDVGSLYKDCYYYILFIYLFINFGRNIFAQRKIIQFLGAILSYYSALLNP